MAGLANHTSDFIGGFFGEHNDDVDDDGNIDMAGLANHTSDFIGGFFGQNYEMMRILRFIVRNLRGLMKIIGQLPHLWRTKTISKG